MSNGLFDKIGDSLKGIAQVAAKGKEACVISAEKRLRQERIKMSIDELRAKKDEQMINLAHIVYEQFIQGKISDPLLLESCHAIKMLQWQLDENWTEYNHINESGR